MTPALLQYLPQQSPPPLAHETATDFFGEVFLICIVHISIVLLHMYVLPFDVSYRSHQLGPTRVVLIITNAIIIMSGFNNNA